MITKELSIPIFVSRDTGRDEFRIEGLAYNYEGQVVAGVGQQITGLRRYTHRVHEEQLNIFLGLEPSEIATAQQYLKRK